MNINASDSTRSQFNYICNFDQQLTIFPFISTSYSRYMLQIQHLSQELMNISTIFLNLERESPNSFTDSGNLSISPLRNNLIAQILSLCSQIIDLQHRLISSYNANPQNCDEQYRVPCQVQRSQGKEPAIVVSPLQIVSSEYQDLVMINDTDTTIANHQINISNGKGRGISKKRNSRDLVFHYNEGIDGTKKRKRRRVVKNKKGSVCMQCSAVKSKEWKRGPLGRNTLCDACGLKYTNTLKEERMQPKTNIRFILNPDPIAGVQITKEEPAADL